MATQALSQGCTEYSPDHIFLEQDIPDTSTYKTTSLAEIFENIRTDRRLDDLFEDPGFMNLDILRHADNQAIVLEHWHAWIVTDPVHQLEECCDLAVLVALSNGSATDSFDFYNAHIMTVAHALRVLWHYLPPHRRVSALRQYALFGLMTYVCQLRPEFSIAAIEAVALDARDWDWVVETALVSPWALDVHFFKVVRAPMVFEETYGHKSGFYLKAAVKYVTEFRGWEGYGKGVAGFIAGRNATATA